MSGKLILRRNMDYYYRDFKTRVAYNPAPLYIADDILSQCPVIHYSGKLPEATSMVPSRGRVV